MSGTPSSMTVAEAANRLVNAILVEFADRDDDALMPVRRFFEDLAEACSVRDFDSSPIPEWETAGWLRARSRAVLAGLANRSDLP